LARLARNTVVFSLATGLSRVIGLVREVVAAALFGTQGAISAFTLAFQIPNLVRSLFADAALSAAFVPVFTELLEQDRRREAARLASSLLFLILAALGGITVVAIALSPLVVPAVTGEEFTPGLDELAVGLTQVMFPIVVLLGLNGLLIGILNAHDRFGIQAFSPVVWNLIIIGFLLAGPALFDGDREVYAYAIGVLVGTAVQLAMAVPVLRTLDVRLRPRLGLRDPRVRQVLALMLPVTIGLGLINFNLLINSLLGTAVSREAPRAIDAAFRVYMLPQGVFSVAIATVLFPALSRLAARGDLAAMRGHVAGGTRLILLLLVPAAAATLVLAEPITRVLYERGDWDAESTALSAEALVWFSLALPLSGINLLLTRTFFSLQRPWTATGLAVASLAVNVVVSLALYRSYGVGGIVAGTAAGTLTTTVTQAVALRSALGGRLEGRATALVAAKVLAASALLALVALAVHRALEEPLGGLVALALALAAGAVVYAGAVLAARVPEADAVRRRVADRIQARRGGDR
jgi:putative peptidoglycan lipid II flippase